MTDYLRLTLPSTPRADIEQFQRPFVRRHILEAYAAASESPVTQPPSYPAGSERIEALAQRTGGVYQMLSTT